MRKPLTCYVLSSMPGLRSALEAEQILLASSTTGAPEVRFIDPDAKPVAMSTDGLVSFGDADVLLCEQKQLVSSAANATGFHKSLKWIMTTSAGVEHAVQTLREKQPNRLRLTRYGTGFGGLMRCGTYSFDDS